MKQNLYRIDDVLLRAGGVTLFAVAGAAGLVYVARLVAQTGAHPAADEIAGFGSLVALAAFCPIALLCAGVTLRRREKRIAAVWNLLRQNAELSVPELLANSSFERVDLERAVRVLNDGGFGHYVWDRRTDTIQDARLRSLQLHVEKCDVCGASVSLQVPIAFREVPRCPHCHDPVSIDSLEALKHETLEALRAEHRPERPSPAPAEPRDDYRAVSGSPMSMPLFILLLFLCWPGALVYAWFKGRRTAS